MRGNLETQTLRESRSAEGCLPRPHGTSAAAGGNASHPRHLCRQNGHGVPVEASLGDWVWLPSRVQAPINQLAVHVANTAVARAQRRLETIGDYRKKIVFKPAPIPKPPVTDMTDLLPPIPLRPLDDSEPNDFPVIPEVMIGPEPNPGIVAPEVGIRPDSNAVSESIKIKLRPKAPNNVLVVVDTNVPGE